MLRGLAIALGCVVLASCASSDATGTDCDPDVEDCIDAGPGDTFDAQPPFDADTTDAGPMFGFGEPCQDKGQCESNICILAGPGGICSETCVAGSCPEGYGCFGVFGAIEPGVVADVCVPTNSTLCSPCSAANECAVIGSDQCVTDPLGKSFCAQDCSTIDCPVGYTCTTVDVGGSDFEQCIPDSGACDCNAALAGNTESCDITTAFGTCEGLRTCAGASGWGGCDPPSTTDTPDATFTDDNCDGIDGDVTRGLFVSTSGTDSATCGLTHLDPCQTISHGIIRAITDLRGELYIQAGDYNEVVTLQNAVDLYGGYDINWERDDHSQLPHRVRIIGGQESTTNQFMAVRADGLIAPTIIADLVIVGPNASGQDGSSGRGSYAVYIENSSNVSFERVTIEAGNGAAGQTGSAGSNAPSVNASSAMNGGTGGNADEFTTACNDSSRGAGGARGNNTCSPGSPNPDGGNGGGGGTMDQDCGFFPDFDAQPGDSGISAPVSSTNSFGFRGAGGSTCQAGGAGRDGRVSNGANGAGGSSGSLVSGFWRTNSGSGGGVGLHGGGGGGGGGSGGCDTGIDSYGAGGGGGAAGGCRAQGGGGGGFGGGASFGVFVVSSTVSLQTCDVVRGTGGTGGTGGIGGRGQSGGGGGAGGLADGDSKVGGIGGDGGHGGHGGGGGGGAGGHSIGIYTNNSTVTQNCSFSSGAGGSGGSGGLSAPTAPVAERDGNDGNPGFSGSVFTVVNQ